jgi:hypothetical protein
MLLGTLGSIGDGLQNPLINFILSDVINDYGNGKKNPLTNDVVRRQGKHVQFSHIYNLFLAILTLEFHPLSHPLLPPLLGPGLRHVSLHMYWILFSGNNMYFL